MSPDNNLPSRLRRRIERLDRRIEQLNAANSRFSWYRLAAFLAGGVLVWLANNLWGNAWGWRAFGVALAAFAAVVWLHRRLDRARECARIWRSLKTAHLARLELDWDTLRQHTFEAAEFVGAHLGVRPETAGRHSAGFASGGRPLQEGCC
jgi:hypothetical protein